MPSNCLDFRNRYTSADPAKSLLVRVVAAVAISVEGSKPREGYIYDFVHEDGVLHDTLLRMCFGTSQRIPDWPSLSLCDLLVNEDQGTA